MRLTGDLNPINLYYLGGFWVVGLTLGSINNGFSVIFWWAHQDSKVVSKPQ